VHSSLQQMTPARMRVAVTVGDFDQDAFKPV
jgi:hypothetical protein